MKKLWDNSVTLQEQKGFFYMVQKDRLILKASCLIVYFAEFILGWNYFSFFQTELKILWIVLFAASFAVTFIIDFITTSKKIKYMLYGFIGLLAFMVPFLWVWRNNPAEEMLAWFTKKETYIMMLVCILMSLALNLINNLVLHFVKRIIHRKKNI